MKNVRAVLRSAIEQANRVGELANQAQGKGSFGEAYPLAAEMVKISRLDAWPLATQAVRDAGLTGNVRVQVVNQAGRPIPNAFVTVLTAHTPVRRANRRRGHGDDQRCGGSPRAPGEGV